MKRCSRISFIGFPNVFADPRKWIAVQLAMVTKGSSTMEYLRYHPSASLDRVRQRWSSYPGGFEAGGASQGLYANKWMPSASDTLTKVWGNHTVKAGFFYEWIRNSQPDNQNTNGLLQVSAGNSFSYGNEYADLLTGNLSNYGETTRNRINDIHYGQYEFFGQDSWKATKKLTLEFGVRFTHFQPWLDALGFGYSIFNQSQFAPSCASSPTFCGFEWHAKNSTVPVGGFPTRTLFYQPRFGVAYDVSGTGNTVVRGGWGRFYYHSGQFTNGLEASAGVAQANLSPSNWVGSTGCPTNPSAGSALFTAYLSCLNLSATPASPSAVDSKDDKQPYTDGWSVNVDQTTPWQGLFELSYVGNRSRDLQNTQGGAGSNLNLVPAGSMLSASNPATANADSYRPLQGYGNVNLATNNLYQNYNAMQVSWARHAGMYVIQTNYTFQKALA